MSTERVAVRVSDAEMNRRWDAVRKLMRERGLQALVAYHTEDWLGGHARWFTDIPTHNGYGRTVIVDHGRGYTTLYAHMSRFGKAKTGARVRQGETIGYVGMSGLASGPHLHYEFRINGAHRDPLKVTLPKPEPLPRSELARFRTQTGPMLAKLEMLDGARAYASQPPLP